MRQQETMVALIADAHIGKRTPSFDLDVAERRIDRWVKKLMRLKGLLEDGYKFSDIHICFLGDINDGTDIYAQMPHEQAETNVLQQAVIVAELFGDAAVKLKDAFGKVTICGVAGNHGRSGKRAARGANWDLVAYSFLEQRFRNDKRITTNFRRVDDFMQFINVRGHDIMLYHGHYIRMYQQVPWYGITTRVLRWAHSFRKEHLIKMICIGHFHQCGMHWLNDMCILLNGTLVTDDEWARATIGYNPVTRWWVFGISNKYAPTWHFDVEVGSDE